MRFLILFSALIACVLSATPIAPPEYRQATSQFNTPQLQLFFYACEGSVDVVKKALGAGAEIDKLSERNFNALHYAKRLNRIEVVRYLLVSGADANARVGEKASTEYAGHTPLAPSLLTEGESSDE